MSQVPPPRCLVSQGRDQPLDCNLDDNAGDGEKEGEVSCSIRLNESSCSNICRDSEVHSGTSDQFNVGTTYG